jgi:hypothetical protein
MNAKTVAVIRAFGFVPDTLAPPTPPESDADAKPVVPGFDGGARRSPPLAPPTHGEWLVSVLAGEVPRRPE